jgi:hypothetical protein
MAKAKIPKRVAGVKLPKTVRKQARQALKLTGSAAVRDLAIAGLNLAAASLLDEAGRAGRAGKKGKSSLASLDLGDVVRAAAAEGARRFLESFEAALPPARGGALPRPPRRKAKAKRAS